MGLRKYISTIGFSICIILTCFGQDADIARCINPKFDKTVASYLSKTIPVISVSDAFEQKSDFLFLDAREGKEYKISHIPGARHIGYDNFDIKSIEDLDKNMPIIVYCSIGYRSEKVGEKLIKKGFSNVYNLYGSIFEWVNQHYPIVDKKGNPTSKIHTYNKKWSKWVQAYNVEKVY